MKKTVYAILANPVSGRMGIAAKQKQLQTAAAILQAPIHGLDTASPEEFSQCARELALQCDILVAAGGDGTFSSVINAVDTKETPLAFLPFGTGNALRHGFRYRGDIADIATRIKNGSLHHYDLIGCERGRKAFMVSIGIEAEILEQYKKQLLNHGRTGFLPYFKAVLISIFKTYVPGQARVLIDGKPYHTDRLLSIMIMKQPYYGYGMNVLPRAAFGDQKLHILCSRFSWPEMILAGATAFTFGNRIGHYRAGRSVLISLEKPLHLQIDGDVAWQADRFQFRILPGALRIKC